MATAHDPASEKIDRAAERDGRGAADPLSDVLRTVKLKGALFFVVDATSPWCVDVPAARAFAELILPTARHLVSYHVAVAGHGVASVPGMSPVAFEAGDIIVFPHGDPYSMASAEGAPPELDREQTLAFFRDLSAGRLPFVISEGGGEPPGAQFICGFLGCDLSPYNPVLSALPRLLRVRRPSRPSPDLLDHLIEMTLIESQAKRVGSESIRLGLSELMFVEVLRRYLADASAHRPSWLAGLQDPVVGRVLALIHRSPSTPWTIERLARMAGTSRSVLSTRFSAAVGQAPIRYLSLWRLQLASRLLLDGNHKVGSIAEQVGFSSEAAFSRAFKREMGQSPANWRARQ